jgi:hypothetical protein
MITVLAQEKCLRCFGEDTRPAPKLCETRLIPNEKQKGLLLPGSSPNPGFAQDNNGEWNSTAVTLSPIFHRVKATEVPDHNTFARQLLRLHEHRSDREFRGVFHVSGVATRDLLAFDGQEIGSRTYPVTSPSGTLFRLD